MPTISKEMGILPRASVEARVGAAPAADENAVPFSFPQLQPWTHGLFWIFPKANSVKFQEQIAWAIKKNILIHFPNLFILTESLWQCRWVGGSW